MGRKQSTDPGNIAASLEPLTINTSPAPVDNQSGFSKVSPKSGSLSNKTSPKVQETSNNKTSPGIVSKSDNNDKNRLIASNYIKTYNNKWNCVVCTYENWPRSTRCVICGSQRSPSIKDISQTTSDLSPLAGHHSSPPNSPRGAAASMPTNKVLKKSDKNNTTFQKLHDKYSELDWLWLKACLGTYDGDLMAVNAYLTCGGDVARQLTAEEATLIEDGSRFQKGHTLLHIALQSQRQDVVASLLTASVTSQSKKRLPPHTCPDLANEILRTVACSLRQRKGDFPCFFFTEVVTFALPGDIEDLLPTVEKQLLNDIMDHDVQRELELEESTINWSIELCERFGSRLYALWNRSAGDCLLDSVLQATWECLTRTTLSD
ncbi:ZRANB1 [Bugula neritina]|uniref:ubiquitinyl hydrolase 1 n=1 Tax=Bugula neritina TaxID=10212 RepID=A0A7J7JY79_BUGNE|nr:ZRANB1 [Bugula neritina]